MPAPNLPAWAAQWDQMASGKPSQGQNLPAWASQWDAVKNQRQPISFGGGNAWGDVAKGAPQAISSGFNRGVFDLLGMPMSAATDVANLVKAGAGYLDSKATGKAPPAWSLPSNPSNVVGTSAWLNRQASKPFGGSIVNVTGDPQSYLLQGLHAYMEQMGPGAFGGANIEAAREPITIEGKATPVGSEMTRNPQSLSAAAASPNLVSASPELRRAVVALRTQGKTPNPHVLERHIQAESLPVPAKLTKGQATQDPMLISLEQNQRGLSNGMFAKHFNEQNQNLVNNLQAMRDRVGPDVFTTNPTEHGEALIRAYKAKAAAADKDIGAKYQALRDANGGAFPVDAKTLQNNANAALHRQLLFEHAPGAEMSQLGAMSDKGMNFEQYEALRTNLARIMRSSTDGNQRAAAGILRREMEDLPIAGETANLKGLADAARSAAKAQFDALDADPAYKAAVNGTVPPDRFVSRFLLNGNKDDIAKMRQNLADNPAAQQTMATAVLDHLRKSARIDDEFRGNFASSSYNNALQALAPKLSAIFNPEHIEDLRNLGDVARYQQAQPRGSFVNNSNTAVAHLAETGKSLAEHAVNAKTLGIGGTLARRVLQGHTERALAKAHLAPGAGLDYVPSGVTP